MGNVWLWIFEHRSHWTHHTTFLRCTSENGDKRKLWYNLITLPILERSHLNWIHYWYSILHVHSSAVLYLNNMKFFSWKNSSLCCHQTFTLSKDSWSNPSRSNFGLKSFKFSYKFYCISLKIKQLTKTLCWICIERSAKFFWAFWSLKKQLCWTCIIFKTKLRVRLMAWQYFQFASGGVTRRNAKMNVYILVTFNDVTWTRTKFLKLSILTSWKSFHPRTFIADALKHLNIILIFYVTRLRLHLPKATIRHNYEG